MRNIVLFVFNGEPMCFIHVLLDEMSGHPSMARFRGDGYELSVF